MALVTPRKTIANSNGTLYENVKPSNKTLIEKSKMAVPMLTRMVRKDEHRTNIRKSVGVTKTSSSWEGFA